MSCTSRCRVKAMRRADRWFPWLVGILLLGLASCSRNAGGAASLPPLPAALIRPASGRPAAYEAFLFVRRGCPCAFSKAYFSLDAARKAEPLSCGLVLVVPAGLSIGELREAGIPKERIVQDGDGRLRAFFGLSAADLPYLVVVPSKQPHHPVLACRVSPVADEQVLMGGLLSTLHSFPGGLRHE